MQISKYMIFLREAQGAQ